MRWVARDTSYSYLSILNRWKKKKFLRPVKMQQRKKRKIRSQTSIIARIYLMCIDCIKKRAVTQISLLLHISEMKERERTRSISTQRANLHYHNELLCCALQHSTEKSNQQVTREREPKLTYTLDSTQTRTLQAGNIGKREISVLYTWRMRKK